MVLECLPCIVTSFLKLLNSDLIQQQEKEPAMRQFLAFLADADYSTSPPALGREMHRLIRQILHNPDPYSDVKSKYNQIMLDLYPHFQKSVKNAKDPFNIALRLAIAGNVIDFGPQNQMDIEKTVENVLHTPLAIDDSALLKNDICEAASILYIGDNCGEIVLDKLFIETINHPNIYFSVRKDPVINDATLEDAHNIGLDHITKVITTGDDSPGAVWETTSEEFKKIFNDVDLVIAKGQGNLEGLFNVKRTFYSLLVVKCDYIGNHLGAKTGDYIVKRLN